MLVTPRRVVAFVLFCFVACAGKSLAQGEDAEQPAPLPPAVKAAKPLTGKSAVKSAAQTEAAGAELSELFTIPQTNSTHELIAFIKRLVAHDIVGENPQEQDAYLRQATATLMEATKLALAAKDLTDEEAEVALSFRFEAFHLQRQLQLPGADQAELKLAEKYSHDHRPALANMAKLVLQASRLRNAKFQKLEDQELLLDETIASLEPDGRLSSRSVQAAIEIGSLLEDSGNLPLAIKSYEKFATAFARSGNSELMSLSKKLQGTARRLGLIGKPVEVQGQLLDGTSLNWSDYSGKVVLIDFWATWCSPCVEELPHIKQLYTTYHSKGFEVVGISLDEEQSRLEAFLKRNEIPWHNLFSTKKGATGMEHPLAVKYGVMQIPCTILVGKDGNVIAMNVSGDKLTKLVDQQLGSKPKLKDPVKPSKPTKKVERE